MMAFARAQPIAVAMQQVPVCPAVLPVLAALRCLARHHPPSDRLQPLCTLGNVGCRRGHLGSDFYVHVQNTKASNMSEPAPPPVDQCAVCLLPWAMLDCQQPCVPHQDAAICCQAPAACMQACIWVHQIECHEVLLHDETWYAPHRPGGRSTSQRTEMPRTMVNPQTRASPPRS
jgi:hypothetical protein